MNDLENLLKTKMPYQHFDSIAVGVLDFNSMSFETIDLSPVQGQYFDLASLTKPLTLASTFLKHNNLFTSDLKLLLDHSGGLPAWGRLSHNGWREQVNSYRVAPSETLYSDFSALRLMTELERSSETSLHELCSYFWDDELLYWNELPESAICPPTGFRNGDIICGEVNDDNCFVIGEFCSHAGLFGTINGVCRSLLNLEREVKLIDNMDKAFDSHDQSLRFINGWDRAMDPKKSLAGVGHSPKTFGHLGFTGTSIWIDVEKRLGHVILTNATENYWYAREGLTEIRHLVGKYVWSR